MFPSLQAGHHHAFVDGCAKTRCVSDEVVDNLHLRHESVRILSAIAAAGQLDRPVGNDKAEAVPAPTPCLTDPAPFEDDVVNTRRGELVAERKPGLSSAHNNGINSALHRAAL